jgi:hypothetical protein
VPPYNFLRPEDAGMVRAAGIASGRVNMTYERAGETATYSTKAKLKKDPNVWAAVKYGPPTTEALMAADSKLTRTSAAAALPPLTTQYEESNRTGYDILVRSDLVF